MSQLKMEKNDLDNVPAIALPEGYVLRTFHEGDEAGLARIYAASDLGSETPEKVRKTILEHPCFKPERVFVLEHAGGPVGTAAAWVEPNEPDCGYLHMVGLLPEHRGKRLGAILSIASIQYSRSEGFRRQRLDTDDWRDPALRLYLGLGYYPLFMDNTHPKRWRSIAKKLRCAQALTQARDLRRE